VTFLGKPHSPPQCGTGILVLTILPFLTAIFVFLLSRDLLLHNSIRSVRYKRHCCWATDCLFTATLTLCRALAYPPVPFVPYPASSHNLFLPSLLDLLILGISHLSSTILLLHCLHSPISRLLLEKYQFGQDPRDCLDCLGGASFKLGLFSALVQ